MLLLSGPPGSGKTHYVLGQLRRTLRSENAGLRFIVPSGRLAEALRIRLAREDLVFRPSMVTTLDRFVSEWVVDAPLLPFQLELIIRRVLERDGCRPFAAVAGRPGFRRLIARLVREFSDAGFDAKRLARAAGAAIPDASLAAAFLRAYELMEDEVLAAGAAFRPVRVERAAAGIRGKGLGLVRRVFIDGFQTFDDAELSLIQAIASVSDLTVTLSAWSGAAPARAAMHAMGAREIELGEARHRFPVRRVVKASGVTEEVAETARRIREYVASGHEFRDIGVILREREPYVPALEAAFDRYGIPARFLFPQPLSAQPAVRYLCGIVNAMLGGWDHEQLLPLLKMPISGFGGSAACDRFEFEVRKRLPGAGLEGLRGVSDAPRLCALLDRMEGLDSWPAMRDLPADWAFRLRGLRCLTQTPQISDGVPHRTAALWEVNARSLDAFSAAADQSASAMSSARPVSFLAYWDVLTAVLETTDFELPDRRLNVVEVLSAEDAQNREWPIVFVCGLIEGGFPKQPTPDPIFSEAARCRLRLTGIPVGTARTHAAAEEFRFQVAATRATSETIFTYPDRDERGIPAIPAAALSRLELEHEDPGMAILEPARAERPRSGYLRVTENLEAVAAAHTAVTPAGIETFTECPFRFFLLSTIELESAPPSPNGRLNAVVQLEILREAFAPGLGAGSAEAAFETAFNRVCERERVPPGPRTDVVRAGLLRTVRRLAAGCLAEDGAGCEIRTSEEVDTAFTDDVRIQGLIDRYDLHAGRGVRLFNFKQAEGVRNGTEDLEGAVYLAALIEHFGYVPLTLTSISVDAANGRHQVRRLDSHAGVAEFLSRVRPTAIRAVREIRRGNVEPGRMTRRCPSCEFSDVCRMPVSQTGRRPQ